MNIKPIDLHCPGEYGSMHLRMENTGELIIVGEDAHRAVFNKHELFVFIEALKSMHRIIDNYDTDV